MDAAAAAQKPPRPAQSRLVQLIKMRAVQRAEALQPLDDVEALRSAHADYLTPQDRVLARAEVLAAQLGLDAELALWRRRLLWVALAAAAGVGLLSYGLISAVVGGDRRINAMAALLAVLGPHLLSLLVWLLSLLFSAGSGLGGGLAGWALGWSTRLPGLRGERQQTARLVLDATLDVLGQSGRLLLWSLGLLTHLIWSLAFVLTLAGLLVAFSFLSYQLTWETTILDGAVFARLAHAVGTVPAWLGFATPDVGQLLTGQGDHRGWAWWLIGCTLVYGLGLRLAALLVSGLAVWLLLRGLTLKRGVDSTDPYIRRLLARFEALQQPLLLDLEQPTAALPGRLPKPPLDPRNRLPLALLGFELPPALAWPPAGLQAAAALAAASDLLASTAGAAAEKRALLARLEAALPQRLLLVCNGQASPDRSTERFLRAACGLAERSALCLLATDTAGAAESLQRWHAWLATLELPLDALFDDVAAAASWAGAQP
jgi:hypothetical protein